MVYKVANNKFFTYNALWTELSFGSEAIDQAPGVIQLNKAGNSVLAPRQEYKYFSTLMEDVMGNALFQVQSWGSWENYNFILGVISASASHFTNYLLAC